MSETDASIKHVFAIRAGAYPVHFRARGDESARDAFPRVKATVGLINKATEEAPHVKGVIQKADTEKLLAVSTVAVDGEKCWTFKVGIPLIFRVHWPRKNQELWFDAGYDGPHVEDMTILFDGLSFVVAAEVPIAFPSRHSYTFGREARRILDDLVPESKEHEKPSGFGPSPMHSIIYLVVGDGLPDDPLGRPLVHEHLVNESLFTMTEEQFEELDGNIGDILQSIAVPMMAFTRLMILRSSFIYETAMLSDAHSTCGQALQPAATPLGFDILKTLRALYRRLGSRRLLRDSVAKAYGHYVRAEELRSAMQKEAATAEERFSRHPLLEGQAALCREQVSEDISWKASHVLEGLRFFAEEARGRALETATVRAAIVWGFLGGGGVLLLTEVF